MNVNKEIELDYPAGTMLYFCGVSSLYRWINNLHLVGKVTAGKSCSIPAYNGYKLIVTGLEKIEINPDVAKENYPNLGNNYLTCRNFQLGAQMFGG